MPFRETSPVAERIALLREFETGVFTVSELCRRHGISRETFYVWQRRWASGEARWYEGRSHAVACCPHATDGLIAERIIAVRRQFPHFGPKKIKARLEDESCRKGDGTTWPAASTIGDILKQPCGAAAQATPCDRTRRGGGAGSHSQRGMGNRFQGLVPHR